MRRQIGTLLVAAAIAGLSWQAVAAGPDPLAGFTQVSDAELALQRGGFVQRDGLELTFGLEEFAMVNGAPIYRRVLHDACACGPGEGALSGMLYRMDPAGTTVRQLSSDGWGTVIQNSLSGQAISHFTMLDIAIGGVTIDRTIAQRIIDSGIVDTLTRF